MIRLLDYHGSLIRDFSKDQFLAHKHLMTDILSENDFGNTGISELIKNYLDTLAGIDASDTSKSEKKFTKNETFLYDICLEIGRLCYKHCCNTDCAENFEEEFI